MKKQIIYQIAALILLLSGCIKEDMSDCEKVEEDGLLIHFVYTTSNGKDEFASRIDQVDLFIFDEDGYYLSEHSYGTRSLEEFQGASGLSLPAGTYHIICWGNVYGNDLLPQLTEEMTIQAAKVAYTTSAISGDSLYYAPRKTTASPNDINLYEVTVPEKGKTEVTLDFMTTYYSLNVYVKGFNDYIGNYNQNPYIEVTHLPEAYDFHLRLGDYAQTFKQVSKSINEDGETYAHSSFRTRYLEERNPVQIHVIRSTTEEIAYTVNLQEILQANRYSLKIGEYKDIDVFIEFLPDGSVEVSLNIKGWNNTEVSPGY